MRRRRNRNYPSAAPISASEAFAETFGSSASLGPKQSRFREALPAEVLASANPVRKDFFFSLDDYLEYVSQLAPCPWPKSRTLNDPYFFGTSSFSEALDLARHGWPEGTVKAREYSAQLKAALDHIEPMEDWRRSVVGGGNIDIASYVQGVPDCFMNFEPIDDEKRFVSIQYNARLGGNVQTESCIRRGVMIAAVVDALESQGYRTRIIWGFANSSNSSNYSLEVYVTIKDYGESLDLDKLVFLTANASAHRRLNWSYKELLPSLERDWINAGTKSAGYGAGASLSESADLSFSEHNNFPTAELAAKYVRELLSNKYGVTI